VPTAVSTAGALSGKTVTDISASKGNGFACAVASGAAYCWGANTYGQLGASTVSTYTATPQAISVSGDLVGKTVTQVSAGSLNTCILASSTAYCWGYNTSFGSTGTGSLTDSAVPTAVYAQPDGVLYGLSLTQISVGNASTCAVATNGKVYCWGGNVYGQLGTGQSGTGIYSGTPVQMNLNGALAGKKATGVSAGEYFALVVGIQL
jgi:alpha-tubulin suppressor-like RCC1 family protein